MDGVCVCDTEGAIDNSDNTGCICNADSGFIPALGGTVCVTSCGDEVLNEDSDECVPNCLD